MRVNFSRKDISRTNARAKVNRGRAYKEQLKKINARWEIKKTHHTQSTTPIDPKLLNKIGLEKKDKVLYFAGCYGDWAKAISHQTELVYTDATKSVLEYAKTRNKGKIKRFKLITAELVPQRPMIYDWSVSYEPIPLLRTNTLKFSLTRSLLNKKGAKLIYSFLYEAEKKETLSQIERIARIYSAEVELKKTFVETNSKRWQKTPVPISTITLKTNPRARKKAFIDLRILNAIDKESSMTIAQIAKKFKISKLEVINSIKRIEALTEETQKGIPLTLIKLIDQVKKIVR